MKKIIFFGLVLYAFSSFAQGNAVDLCSKSRISNFNNTVDIRETGNQNDFDLTYYKLYMELHPNSKQITAKTEINCISKIDYLDKLDFDLTSSLNVKRVLINGDPTSFEHNLDILEVSVDKNYMTGEIISLSIEYYGLPGSTFHFDTKYGKPMIWTLSEPYGSKDWWPCKNFPDDKLDSLDMIITVDSNLVVASNGVLSAIDTIGNKLTFHWKERYPIATYLVSLAVYPYKIRTDYYHYDNDSMPVVNYIFAKDFDKNNQKYAIVPEMLEVLSSYYGQYPFVNEKYGNAEFLWGGGMEHQTLTSLIGPYEYLIVHELGHQWWGDMITCRDFHHIWLNEGFASYTEALWAEHKGGEEALHNYMENKRYLGHGTIYVENATNAGRIFSGALSYNKASWVLHMLRHITGDSIFFEIFHRYADSDKKYDVATTEDFARICNEVSGKDLTKFFDQWIYGDYHPVYLYDWNYRQEQTHFVVELKIEQFQIENLFSMPIDISIITENGEKTFVIENDDKLQTYIFTMDSKPVSLVLDKDEWILKEVREGIDIANHDNNDMILSISSNGAFGYIAPDDFGNGLIFPKDEENRLFYGSLIMGNSRDYIVDNSEKDKILDFQVKEGTGIEINKTNISNLDIFTRYSDANHPQSKNIDIKQSSYSWSLDPYRDFVLISYNIKNNGTEDIDSFYAGQFMDFDIAGFLDDNIDNDEDQKMIYQYGNNVFLGIKSLNSNSENIYFSGVLNAIDTYDENKKYDYLTGKNNDFKIDKKGDWASLISTGPYTLLAGDSISVAFAIVGGNSKADLFQNADYAQSLYDHFITSNNELPAFNTTPQINVFPNPVFDKLYIEIFSNENKKVSISIYNVIGKKIYSENRHLNTGENHFQINRKLKSGIYFYKIKIGKIIKKGKLIVVN